MDSLSVVLVSRVLVGGEAIRSLGYDPDKKLSRAGKENATVT